MIYRPANEVAEYLKSALTHEIAESLPSLQLKKVQLESYSGEVGPKIKADFSECKVEGNKDLSLEQKQYLMGKYLVEINDTDVFINTQQLQADL